MKILFADKYPKSAVDELKKIGHDCVLQPDLKADELDSVLAEFDVLVVRSTQVTKKAIEAGNTLKMIVRAGAGTNTIDKECAAKKGIYVCNVPSKNAIAVAELTLGLILAIDRKIHYQFHQRWHPQPYWLPHPDLPPLHNLWRR